jgi:hypothetical protein
MNDDLHNIDDLFRKGIEGHEEDLSPSVWEAVSNDLDKKQASYYKRKYNRLKRASLLLLLLCFVGGVYIIYKEQPVEKEKASAQKKPAQAATKTTQPPTDKTNATPPVANNENEPNDKVKREEEKLPISDTASTSAIAPASPLTINSHLQRVERNNVAGLSTNPNPQHLRPEPSRVLLPRANKLSSENGPTTKKETTNTNQFIAARNGKPANNKPVFYQTNSSLPQLASSPFARLRLTGRDYVSPVIELKALQANDQFILPRTNTVSSKSKSNPTHRFSLSAFAAPNLRFDRLEDDDRLAGPGRNRQEAHRQEQKSFSFSAGFLVSYDLTKHLLLQSGVSLTSSATSIAPTTVFAKRDNGGRMRYELQCSSGYVYISPKGSVQPMPGDSSAKTSGTVSKLTYVSVPASLHYRVRLGRFSLSPSIGAGLNFLTSGKTKTSLSNTTGSESTSTPILGLKSTYVDAHLGMGLDYDLGKKLSVGIRPNARLALTPINNETPVKSYQNFLSVETGVRIKF